MDDSSLMSVVRERSLQRADHSSRVDLPRAVCPTECDRGTSYERPRFTRAVEPQKYEKYAASRPFLLSMSSSSLLFRINK